MGRNSVRGTLAALTASLIGVPVADAADINRTETSILIYSENERTQALEATFSLSKELKNQFLLDLRLTYDGLTGATPTGASPSKYPQTLTRASGGESEELEPGSFPLDGSFNDTRFAADATMSRQLGKLSVVKFGTHLSSEHDYSSVGLNFGVNRDFNGRNTTVGIAGSFSKDVVKPVTGFNQPFSEVGLTLNETAQERLARFKGRNKRVSDIVFSLAQIISRGTVVRFSYSYSRASGYLTDPYKIFSIVQSPDSADPGEPILNLFEKRPDARRQSAVFSEIRKQIFGRAAAFSYRFYWDDWQIRSHTADFSMHFDFKRKGAVLPRVRWYQQSGANFHVPFLIQGDPLPSYASADSRLAQFRAFTYGLGYSYPLSSNSKVNLSFEYYMQRGQVNPPASLAQSINFGLFPELNVIMLRLGYAHEFF